MFVRNIVDTKTIRNVITIKPTDSITAAAELLAKHRIGAVVVSRDGSTVDGILSERDIVRSLGLTGIECMNKQVQDLMTATVVGCKLDETADSILERMTEGRFRHMPVIDDNRMVGVISIGDVVKRRMEQIERDAEELRNYIATA